MKDPRNIQSCFLGIISLIEFRNIYKAWHGSLNRSDSYVPLIVAYPGGNVYEVRPLITNVQGCSVDQGCHGNWRTTDLVIEIIQRQYTE